MRSKWKGPFNKSKKELNSRSSEITPSMINKSYKVYAGKKKFEITITDEMLGHKLGEFTKTRADFIFKKKKKKK